MRTVHLFKPTNEERDYARGILKNELPAGTVLSVMPVERLGRERDETLMKVFTISLSAIDRRPRIADYSMLVARALGCEVETHVAGPVVWSNAMNVDPGLMLVRALGKALHNNVEAFVHDRL